MTALEMLVAMGIVVTVSGVAFTLLDPNQRVYRAQLEAADLQQRVRVAVEALRMDLLPAEAIRSYGDDAIMVLRGGDARIFCLQRDAATGVSQLRRESADGGSVPIVDHAVALRFEYFDDVVQVRRVRVTLRLQGESRLVPDQEVRFDVSPRNRHPPG